MEKKVVGILLGDAAGIGPELVTRSAANGFLEQQVRPVIIGDVRILEDTMQLLNLQFPYYVVDDKLELDESRGIAVYDTKDQDPARVVRGQMSAYCGQGDINMVKTACRFCMEGKLAGFCYGSLHKGAMREAGMQYESESELMAAEFHCEGKASEINMMGELMTVRVTSHIPFREISDHLNKENILETICLAYETARSFGFEHPRIAVSGLNPHNGENGKCGMEEIEVIRPAVEAAIEKGMQVTGPYPGDTVFMNAFKGAFDVVVTMYHDQGQIALKSVGFENSVTVDGGLGYPITTPAHGTALDLAGKGIASTTAFENAVRVLANMVSDKSY